MTAPQADKAFYRDSMTELSLGTGKHSSPQLCFNFMPFFEKAINYRVFNVPDDNFGDAK